MQRMLCTLAIALTTVPAHAALYKCVGDTGHVTYADTPCAAGRVLAVDAAPAPAEPAGLRPGEKAMLERAWRRDEREAEERARSSRNAAAEARLNKLRKRKDEIAKELRGSIGGKAERSALVDERRSIEREMATLRPRR
jgi:hypothetical protein